MLKINKDAREIAFAIIATDLSDIDLFELNAHERLKNFNIWIEEHMEDSEDFAGVFSGVHDYKQKAMLDTFLDQETALDKALVKARYNYSKIYYDTAVHYINCFKNQNQI